MDQQDRVRRLTDAAALVAGSIEQAAPLPWGYYEEHGRDYTDEGWSVVGAKSSAGEDVLWTYGPGYETESAEGDAALAILLTSAAPDIVTLLRRAAERVLDDPDDPLLVAAEAIAGAIYGMYDDVDRETVQTSQGDVVRTIVVGGRLRRADRD